MFTLNTKLIPDLKRNGITFRFIDGVYNTMTIIITHKNLDICRVDVNRNSNEPYNYCVYWFNVVDFVSCREDKYALSENLVGDIKIAISHLESRGENKMNKKMYRVTDIEFKSSPYERDEINFTVNVMRPRNAWKEDGDRIKEAIESIGERNEIPVYRDITDIPGIPYLHVARGNGKSQFLKELYYNTIRFDIKDVIFNDPATIVLWADGTKTVVKAENEPFDPEKGLAMAISKRALGGKYNYYDTFKKYVGRYEKFKGRYKDRRVR